MVISHTLYVSCNREQRSLARTDDAGSAARATAGMATVAQNLARRRTLSACSGFKSLRAYPALANLDEIVRHRWPSLACRPKQQSWIQSACDCGRIRKRRGAMGAAPLSSIAGSTRDLARWHSGHFRRLGVVSLHSEKRLAA